MLLWEVIPESLTLASGALPKNVVGPGVAIGSHIHICDRPTPLHRQPHAHMRWAHFAASAATCAHAMGPFCCIGSISQILMGLGVAVGSHICILYAIGPPCCIGSASQKINWPRHSHRQQHIHERWVHPIASATIPKKNSAQM